MTEEDYQRESWERKMWEQAEEAKALEEYWQEYWQTHEEWAHELSSELAVRSVYETPRLHITDDTFVYATAYYDSEKRMYYVCVIEIDNSLAIQKGYISGYVGDPYYCYCGYNTVPTLASTLLLKYVNDKELK